MRCERVGAWPYLEFRVVGNDADTGRFGGYGNLPDAKFIFFHWMRFSIPVICNAGCIHNQVGSLVTLRTEMITY